jgi:putative DNA primase/helicase
LKGLNQILENEKITKSPKSEAKMNEIKQETNSVAGFMEEHGYIPSSKEHEDLKVLYQAYNDYCDGNGHYPVSKTEFTRRLEKVMGYKIKRKATGNATWVFCMSYQDECQKQIQKEIDDMIEKFMI